MACGTDMICCLLSLPLDPVPHQPTFVPLLQLYLHRYQGTCTTSPVPLVCPCLRVVGSVTSFVPRVTEASLLTLLKNFILPTLEYFLYPFLPLFFITALYIFYLLYCIFSLFLGLYPTGNTVS